MIIPQKIKYLIAKELRGTLTQEERLLLNKWYDAQYGETFSREGLPDLPSKNFSRLEKEMGLARTNTTIRVWVGMAAACLVFFLVFYYQNNELTENIVSQVEAENMFETVQNGRGIRRSVTLVDGSIIYLNSHSTIEIHKKFSINRIVRLEGEAYFEVAKDSLHPFIVHTQDIETRVLGTAFSVQAFKDKPQVIAVKEGKVNVTQAGGNTYGQTLERNDQMVVSTEATFGTITKIDPQLVFAWVEGTIIFDRKPLREVLNELSEWYDLESLEIEAINKNCIVTGTYPRMKLVDILESIKYATGITYELNGKQLTVKNGNC
ncbi:FecR family protein [Lunatibacter salilacus]|uniref:FecR family protein n=1 Tax=Lunatibacter salilacus TaxID=2483804 RepID=UPI00131EAC7B|nr:FecR family protein [Lunatibacter salilacus]